MRVTVRDGVPADADEIGRIHVHAWQVAYRGHMPDEFLNGLSVSERQAQWRRRLLESHETDRVMVAEVDASVAGFAVVGPTRDEGAGSRVGEVMAINLDPDRWGQGIGRALLSACVNRLRESGFERATLWVLEGNERARRFYEAAGWAPDGARKVEQAPSHERHEVRYAVSLR